MKKSKTVSFCALFAIITAIMSWISVPTPLGVPVTLQTLAAALCGFVLGSKRGVTAISVYLLLGAAGAPVFSMLQGGMGILLSANGGFLFGFIALAFACGKSMRYPIWAVGLLICHAAGILQFCLVSGCSLTAAFLTASLPFLPKDIILVITAKQISKRINIKDAYD